MSTENEAPIEEIAPAQTEAVTPAEPVAETPAEEVVDEQPVEAATEVETAPEVDEPEEKSKPKSRFQERIDKLTADKYTAEREARALRERLENLSHREPRQVDPDDFEALEAERMRKVYDETRREDYSYEVEKASRQAQIARVELFETKLEDARERIPNLDAALESFGRLPVTEDSAELIADSPYAADLAHHLGSNPKAAHQLASMSPAQQGREIARLEARFNLPKKKVSSAPPPPARVSTNSVPLTKDPREMSAADYVKMRKAEWNKS